MKLTSKHQYFRPNENSGLYENAFLKTGRLIIEEEFARVVWFFGYIENNEDKIVRELPVISFGEKQDTIIENENGQPEELRAFLQRGGTYSKEKIIHWGRPSKNDMLNDYLNSETLTGDLQLTDNEPQRTIAKDWLLERVFAFGKPLGKNFEFEGE